MANGNRTTSKPRGASVTKATEAASVQKDGKPPRPHFLVMDKLNQALAELSDTVQTLHAVDTHIIEDIEDNRTCRTVLSRQLMTDLATLKAAEREAWRRVVAREGGAQRSGKGENGRRPG
jgi:hypothetical protein